METAKRQHERPGHFATKSRALSTRKQKDKLSREKKYTEPHRFYCVTDNATPKKTNWCTENKAHQNWDYTSLRPGTEELVINKAESIYSGLVIKKRRIQGEKSLLIEEISTCSEVSMFKWMIMYPLIMDTLLIRFHPVVKWDHRKAYSKQKTLIDATFFYVFHDVAR